MRALPIALLALVASLAPGAVASGDQHPSLPDIEDEVMCPMCGTSLELSGSPQAERERELIRGLIAEGRSKDEIKDALVAEYGPDVLATPDSEGFDLAAWLVPGAGILVGAVALFLAARRWRRARGAPRAAQPSSSPGELERLDRDLSSYDL